MGAANLPFELGEILTPAVEPVKESAHHVSEKRKRDDYEESNHAEQVSRVDQLCDDLLLILQA